MNTHNLPKKRSACLNFTQGEIWEKISDTKPRTYPSHRHTHIVCKWNAEARAKTCFPTHKQTLACVHSALFKSSETRTVLQQRQAEHVDLPERKCQMIDTPAHLLPITAGSPQTETPRRSLPSILHRRFYEKKRNKKRKGEGGKVLKLNPRPTCPSAEGGLDRTEIKSLWEHCDHNPRNPQPLQLSLTGPKTPTHTHPRSGSCGHVHKCSQTNN